jgi:hypothetical protein
MRSSSSVTSAAKSAAIARVTSKRTSLNRCRSSSTGSHRWVNSDATGVTALTTDSGVSNMSEDYPSMYAVKLQNVDNVLFHRQQAIMQAFKHDDDSDIKLK